MMHDHLTIVSVYGHNDGACAVPSIMHSMKELPGSKGLLLSRDKPFNLPSTIEWRRVGIIDYLQYSVFMMHGLQHHIKTDYALVVQDDGWVLNGKNFTEEFYEYDYIGAPSHCGRVGDQFILSFGWADFEDRMVVQNGGFSLRSKRFLEAPNKFGIVHKQANDIHNWNEDAQLTAIFRRDLEACGMKYATEDVAKRFSIEYVGPKFHDDFDFNTLVGHHAQSRRLIGDKYVRVTLPHGEIKDMHGEERFIQYLSDLGYTIEYTYDRRNSEKTTQN